MMEGAAIKVGFFFFYPRNNPAAFQMVPPRFRSSLPRTSLPHFDAALPPSRSSRTRTSLLGGAFCEDSVASQLSVFCLRYERTQKGKRLTLKFKFWKPLYWNFKF